MVRLIDSVKMVALRLVLCIMIILWSLPSAITKPNALKNAFLLARIGRRSQAWDVSESFGDKNEAIDYLDQVLSIRGGSLDSSSSKDSLDQRPSVSLSNSSAVGNRRNKRKAKPRKQVSRAFRGNVSSF